MGMITESKNAEVSQLDKEQVNQFRDQIWRTRVSRVNAEKRLKHKESFAEGLNIYYSCFTVMLSIFLFLVQNEGLNRILSAISLTMTIIVTICILHCKSLRYADRARDYKRNYTELQKLEFSLKHITSLAELKEIERKYCELLAGAENHIPYDDCKTVWESKKSYKDTLAKNDLLRIRAVYIRGRCWRFVIEAALVILPILICLICWYFGVRKYG